ncbi:DUF84 family protein [Alkalihalophilus lindianensis]|uniref:inosine/xanthosine triphosphatase n=1 Tax=Alkalihalophilus lindianensis TaxID=1630542 RepID=A0ABU3XGG6_9BACI|nr:DUF84 family protein [Alkalihalophilus lindianensis]MDV2686403.1 DUF84 family protein [Alkalihalophilus lindianensis]
MKVVIGTKNRAKIHAVMETLVREPFEFISVEAPSGVSAQPFSDEETMKGAINRAKYALTITDAKLAIGLEGGVSDTSTGLMLCNWGAMTSHSGQVWVASGAKIPLPLEVQAKLRDGQELGTIMGEMMKDHRIRHKEGAIGVLTSGRLTRKSMFSHIVQMLYGQYEYNYQPFSH